MTKVQMAVPARDKESVLRWLQDESILHVVPLPQMSGAARQAAETQTAYHLAQLQFALEFMRRIQTELHLKPKRSWKNLFAGKPIASLDELEAVRAKLNLERLLSDVRSTSDQLAQLQAQQTDLQERLLQYLPWQQLRLTGQQLRGTEHTEQILLVVNLPEEERVRALLDELPTAVWQEAGRQTDKRGGMVYLEVVVAREQRQALQDIIEATSASVVMLDLEETQTPADAVATITEHLQELSARYAAEVKTAQSYLAQEHDLKLVYDALAHEQEREQLELHTTRLPLSFIVSGWVPSDQLSQLSARLSRAYPAVAIEAVEPEENEVPPVMFTNARWLQPFEAVTNIYGKPAYHEIDPSPALSIFFLAAFGLALTDAGYGLILMATMGAAERFFKLKREMRKMVRLLFYAGASTTIIGALTGGWFGITLEQLAPSTLRDLLLSIKLVDPISDPMSLLFVAFALGIAQLLFAWVVNGFVAWRRGDMYSVVVDNAAWITMIVGVLLWAGVQQGFLPEAAGQPLTYFLLANAGVLVATQGRSYKNIFIRVGVGLISLYGLISFLSDVLSYSRLLALGLATGIIGLVVNLIGSMIVDMVPVVGFVLAAIVLLIGHVFNLGINVLGAFIHSGRLQFVEFFPKFMQGGGVPYKPFGRVGKYVDSPKEFE